MNVAVLFSGRVDWVDQAAFEQMNNIINPFKSNGHNIDIFASFWNNNDVVKFIDFFKPMLRVVDIEFMPTNPQCIMPNLERYESLIDEYNPTKDNNLLNGMFLSYKINRCFNIAQQYSSTTNVRYDLYVRMRTNISQKSPLDISVISQLDDSSIMTHVDRIVSDKSGKLWGCGDGWVDDNFCIAREIPYKIYVNTYNGIISLSLECKSCISHLLLRQQFAKNNIRTVMPNSPMIYHKNNRDIYVYFKYLYD